MKKLILLGLVLITITACQKQEQRYFAESAEINVLKAGIEAYETGDWDQWMAHFSDTAKIYVNSTNPVDVKTRMNELKGAAANFSTYGFDKKDEFIEMVIDKEKETWVYYWAQWNGELAANGKKISVPVHLAVQFTDGKITKEHVYFDGTEMNKEMAALVNMSADEKAMSKTVETVVRAWNSNDQNLMASVMTDDFIRTENGNIIAKNPTEYAKNLMDVYHGAFPDFKVHLDDMMNVGNKVLINWTCTGTNTESFLGNPATNKPIKTHGFSVWTFGNDGKVTREDAFYDNMVVFQQLDYTMPAPK